MSEKRLQQVLELLNNEKALEAKKVFSDIQQNENALYFLVKGKIEQKFQNMGEAINAYNKVLELDPENQEAQNSLHVIQNILNFWNPEMFNP